MDKKSVLLTRRKAIQGAASLVGGSIAVAQFGPLAIRVAKAADEGSPPVFFSQAQFSLVERVVDLILPETDTPGAVAAGVHYFVDLMMAEWASPARQERYRQGIEAINSRAQTDGKVGFVSLSMEYQMELLQMLDREAYEGGATDVFFREFKKLVLFGYYSSEVGATVELRYEPTPVDYEPCVPIEDPQRAWFWLGYSYGL